ncbi:MAG: potassium-transporting ATPase subunit KdpA, partial [Bryobacteraceae bacterium]
MTSNGLFQIGLYVVVLLLLVKPMGAHMARVFQGERTFLHPVLRPLESLIYRICGIEEAAEQSWKRYAGGVLV